MTAEEIQLNEYLKLGASQGSTFETLLEGLRNNGTSIPMSMEGALRAQFDAFGGAKSPYQTVVAPTVEPVVNDPAADFNVKGLPKSAADSTKTATALPAAGGVNNLIGDNPWMSMAGAFGDKNTTGWAGPAIGLASAVGKGILGYKQFEETKKMNAEKLKLMEEANFMKKLKMKNQVNQANRYAMLGMGNSNSATATMGAVNRTPYTSMGL